MSQGSESRLPSPSETPASNASPSHSGTTISSVPAFLSNAASLGIQGGEFNNVAGHIYNIDARISDVSRSRSAGQEGSAIPSPLRWIWSLYSTFVGGRVPQDCQIYAQSLMPNGVGFPLWFPEPGGCLPMGYRMKGVSIGDVGLITPDGAFDYLFNICLPLDDPANINRVPENFLPLEPWDPSDVHKIAFAYPPGGHVASGSIERGVSVNIGHEYSFQCLTSQGAILTLPDGASRENLRNLTSFREYACRNAVNWYSYANGTRGREARNGSIYLVTGCDKGKSWGIAAFANESSLAKTRAGPMPIDYLEGTQDRAQNQCLFMRGFRVALGQGVSANLVGQAGISRIEDTNARDMFPSSVPGAGESLGQGSSFSRQFQLSGGQGDQENHQSGGRSTSETTRSGGPEDVILVSDFPDTSDTYHPSYVVNQYLLEQTPSANVAITHDDDWGSVIGKDETVLPDASELICRIQNRYEVLFESGAVSLVVKDAAVQPSSPAPGHKLEAEASTDVDHVPALLVASPASEPATLTPTTPTPISKPNPTSKSSIWPKSTSLLRPFRKSSFSSNALSSSSTHSLTPTPSFSTPTRHHHIVFSRFNSSQPRLEKQDGTGLPKHSINKISKSRGALMKPLKNENKENLDEIINNTYDPFAAFIAPPPGETPAEKSVRERREAEAQRISDKIDEDIRHEHESQKQQKSIVRVLLLGQSESGKSTTLKNFRMMYAHAAWEQERASWRAVIQLNLIRSVITILDLLQAEKEGGSVIDDQENDQDDIVTTVTLTHKHELLKVRLAPLRGVEGDLRERLGAGPLKENVASEQVLLQTSPFQLWSESNRIPISRRRQTKELVVRGWQDALERRKMPNRNGVTHFADDEESDKATDVIACCKEDIKALWSDEVVQTVLTKHKRRLEHLAAFFLDDLDRVATRSYLPSDDDVVRARLRTTGVQEHRIHFDQRMTSSQTMSNDNEWIIYDVGGSRTCRHAWLPFFETVNAIIFLAPISCFDERLPEDRQVNRLEDSLILWRDICSSTMLSKTTMIVFLNKCDLLTCKLKSGVQIRKHLPSYGDRPNDAPTFIKYVRAKFKNISQQYSPVSRTTFYYSTSVIDTHATVTTLHAVREGILREHLKMHNII